MNPQAHPRPSKSDPGSGPPHLTSASPAVRGLRTAALDRGKEGSSSESWDLLFRCVSWTSLPRPQCRSEYTPKKRPCLIFQAKWGVGVGGSAVPSLLLQRVAWEEAKTPRPVLPRMPLGLSTRGSRSTASSAHRGTRLGDAPRELQGKIRDPFPRAKQPRGIGVPLFLHDGLASLSSLGYKWYIFQVQALGRTCACTRTHAHAHAHAHAH